MFTQINDTDLKATAGGCRLPIDRAELLGPFAVSLEELLDPQDRWIDPRGPEGLRVPERRPRGPEGLIVPVIPMCRG